MQVDVVVTPKLIKRIFCAKFRVVEGTLLFYADVRMTQLLEGFKVWRRFNVVENEVPINLVPVTKNKIKKGV